MTDAHASRRRRHPRWAIAAALSVFLFSAPVAADALWSHSAEPDQPVITTWTVPVPTPSCTYGTILLNSYAVVSWPAPAAAVTVKPVMTYAGTDTVLATDLLNSRAITFDNGLLGLGGVLNALLGTGFSGSFDVRLEATSAGWTNRSAPVTITRKNQIWTC